MDRTTTAGQIRLILGTLLVVVLPASITHAMVRVPVSQVTNTDNPTPWGYTVSLLLFIVPVVAIAAWHLRHGHHFDRKAFIVVCGLMAGLGATLDFAFGYAFLEFPNPAATLGIRLPAWSWSEARWIPDYLPIEEFVFYIFGAVFMIAAYLWADRNWLTRYHPEDYGKVAKEMGGVFEVSPHAIAVWAVLLMAGLGYRFLYDGGFPGYFVFLMVAGLLPTVVLVRNVKKMVNWHALAFSFTALVLISVIWEASLGVPYGWWDYRPEEMLGIFVVAWGPLPIEAVILWLVGVWDAVLFYELFRILFHKEEKFRHGLFGTPPG